MPENENIVLTKKMINEELNSRGILTSSIKLMEELGIPVYQTTDVPWLYIFNGDNNEVIIKTSYQTPPCEKGYKKTWRYVDESYVGREEGLVSSSISLDWGSHSLNIVNYPNLSKAEEGEEVKQLITLCKTFSCGPQVYIKPSERIMSPSYTNYMDKLEGKTDE